MGNCAEWELEISPNIIDSNGDCLLFISGDVQDEDKLVRAESQAGANLYLYQVRTEQNK